MDNTSKQHGIIITMVDNISHLISQWDIVKHYKLLKTNNSVRLTWDNDRILNFLISNVSSVGQ